MPRWMRRVLYGRAESRTSTGNRFVVEFCHVGKYSNLAGVLG
jgi:hypothetical protein